MARKFLWPEFMLDATQFDGMLACWLYIDTGYEQCHQIPPPGIAQHDAYLRAWIYGWMQVYEAWGDELRALIPN